MRVPVRRSFLVLLFGFLFALSTGTASAQGVTPNYVYGNGVCDAGELCLYEHDNYGGVFTEWNCNQASCRLLDFRHHTFHDGSSVNDRVTSVWNRLDKPVALFQEPGAEPGQCCFYTFQRAGSRGDRISNVGREFNDSFSSVLMG